MSRSRERLVPLAVLVAFSVFAACLGTLAVSAAVLGTTGNLGVPLWQVLAAGAPVALVFSLAGAFGAGRLAGLVTSLRRDALRRLQDPSAPVAGADAAQVPTWAGSELVALARTLDALHRRVRMADEVGERHRRSAETASVGMFELLAGLVEAEEGARGQLSAELHDTVAQSLMRARSLLSSEPAEVDEAAELVAEAEEQVRAVMARTRPPALRDGDLARAVGTLQADLEHRYGLQVDLSWPSEPYPLPLVTAVTVYRFFQEALLNVVKHSDADTARAELRIDEDFVTGIVVDDGPGFDPSTVRSEQGRHVGLGLLRERARLVGGSLEVTSAPGCGTALTLRLPRVAGSTAGLLPLPRNASRSVAAAAR
jgi:signal transduction histidine kinase